MKALDARNAERNLRRALLVDVAASGVTALGLAALAGPVGRQLDVPAASVGVVAAGLVPWVVALVALARAEQDRLARFTPLVVAGNVGWVAATAVLLATGVIDRSGWWLPVPVALAVADLGLVQWLLWRALPARSTAPAPLAAT